MNSTQSTLSEDKVANKVVSDESQYKAVQAAVQEGHRGNVDIPHYAFTSVKCLFQLV